MNETILRTSDGFRIMLTKRFNEKSKKKGCGLVPKDKATKPKPKPTTPKSVDYSRLEGMLICTKPSDVSFRVCKYHEGTTRCINCKKDFLDDGEQDLCASEIALSNHTK